MLAVPNYARMNRVAREHSEIAGDNSVNYAPGATNNVDSTKNQKNAAKTTGAFQGAAPSPNSTGRRHDRRKIESKVWMQSLA